MKKSRFNELESVLPALTKGEKQHIKFLIRIKIIKTFLRSGLNAYQTVPIPLAISIQSSLISFLILNILPHHLLAIPTAFGGGISFALLIDAATRSIISFKRFI